MRTVQRGTLHHCHVAPRATLRRAFAAYGEDFGLVDAAVARHRMVALDEVPYSARTTAAAKCAAKCACALWCVRAYDASGLAASISFHRASCNTRQLEPPKAKRR